MMGEKNKSQSQLPPATKLIFHCHGGGFVAQSSKSHELYLREWAVALDIPIFSVDYSLAPGKQIIPIFDIFPIPTQSDRILTRTGYSHVCSNSVSN